MEFSIMEQSVNPFSRGYLSYEIRRVARGHIIVHSIFGKPQHTDDDEMALFDGAKRRGRRWK
jgi:hypothetical protein